MLLGAVRLSGKRLSSRRSAAVRAGRGCGWECGMGGSKSSSRNKAASRDQSVILFHEVTATRRKLGNGPLRKALNRRTSFTCQRTETRGPVPDAPLVPVPYVRWKDGESGAADARLQLTAQLCLTSPLEAGQVSPCHTEQGAPTRSNPTFSIASFCSFFPSSSFAPVTRT